MAQTAARKRILVVSMLRAGTRSHSYYVSQSVADQMVARGQAVPADDGTRRIFERTVKARGSLRVWRKITNRSKHGVPLYSSMQLAEPSSRAPRHPAPINRNATG